MRVPHLSPTTLTTDEQRLILRATSGNVRDHTIISLALGTGLRLAEIVGLDGGDKPIDNHRPVRRRYQSNPVRMTPTRTSEEVLGVKYGYTMKSSPMTACGQRDCLFP